MLSPQATKSFLTIFPRPVLAHSEICRETKLRRHSDFATPKIAKRSGSGEVRILNLQNASQDIGSCPNDVRRALSCRKREARLVRGCAGHARAARQCFDPDDGLSALQFA